MQPKLCEFKHSEHGWNVGTHSEADSHWRSTWPSPGIKTKSKSGWCRGDTVDFPTKHIEIARISRYSMCRYWIDTFWMPVRKGTGGELLKKPCSARGAAAKWIATRATAAAALGGRGQLYCENCRFGVYSVWTTLGKPPLTKESARLVADQFFTADFCPSLNFPSFALRLQGHSRFFFIFPFEAAASESAMDSSSKVLTLTADVRETQKSTWRAGQGRLTVKIVLWRGTKAVKKVEMNDLYSTTGYWVNLGECLD